MTARALRLHDAGHLLDDFRLARPIARRRRREIEDDANVGGRRAVLGRKHRIEIHLGNFRKIRNQRGHPFDHPRQCRTVHGLGAAHAAQDLRRLDAVQHRQGIFLRCRSEAEGDVLQDFDENAAEAECHELAECRVGYGADDHFLAARQHLLNLHAEYFRLGVVLFGIADDGRIGLFGVLGGFHADDDAARFGLVQNLRRHDLHHHRKAYP